MAFKKIIKKIIAIAALCISVILVLSETYTVLYF